MFSVELKMQYISHLTHWGLNKMADIFRNFKCDLFSVCILISLKFHGSLTLRVLPIESTLVQVIVWRWIGNKHYLGESSFIALYGITRQWWVKSKYLMNHVIVALRDDNYYSMIHLLNVVAQENPIQIWLISTLYSELLIVKERIVGLT